MEDGILDVNELDVFGDEEGFEAAVIMRLIEERDAYRSIAIEKAWAALDPNSPLDREQLGEEIDHEVVEEIGFSDEIERFKKVG